MKLATILSLLIILMMGCSSTPESNTDYKFNAELDGFDYGMPVDSFSFETQKQKLKMSYVELGRDHKKVVVLLHGKNFAGYYWKQIAETLVEKGYRVIIPDQIGFGKSSKPQHYQYSFAQLSYNTKLLLSSLDIKDYEIVGHSMGGMLAIHMAYKEPRVSRVVLINPIGLEDYLSYVEYKDPQFFYENEKNKTVLNFRNYQIKNYYDGKWKESYEELLTPFKGWKAGEDFNLLAWNNALTYGPIFSEPITEKLKIIETPVHLILGTRDRTGPGRNWKREGVKRKLGQYHLLGKEVSKKNSKFIKLTELEGLGHMPQFEDYQRFSATFYPLF